jgi:hypothetical protein
MLFRLVAPSGYPHVFVNSVRDNATTPRASAGIYIEYSLMDCRPAGFCFGGLRGRAAFVSARAAGAGQAKPANGLLIGVR